MKTGYTVLYKGYNTIKDLSKGNFNLHKVFLDGLLQISPTVKKYQRVVAIIQDQGQLFKLYTSAVKRFKSSGYFTTDELQYITNVCNRTLQKSLQHLDELTIILTAGKLRMSDQERLAAIDNIYADIHKQWRFLQYFNREVSLLGVQKARTMASQKGAIALFKTVP
ncbi:TerB family tellurite resistance protein [Zhouia sp. PK063]|uniref:TerB family tellurite resistance protein n=1 Tax=Zhouia sp. PK063 TaxID=3373602 RepID=UPI0037B6DD0D